LLAEFLKNEKSQLGHRQQDKSRLQIAHEDESDDNGQETANHHREFAKDYELVVYPLLCQAKRE
jgi:hypothetical protein